MMNYAVRMICSLAIGSSVLPARAQNLVPNGSFEEYSDCPTYFGLASWSTGWQNLYTQSADYFNACHTGGVVGIPLNQFGDQYPADGDAYMGMATYAYNQPEYREMVGIQLTEPLQVGIPVCLSFKTAVAGFGTSVGNSAGYTCKGVGMKFFSTLPTEQYIYDYPNSAALYIEEVPTDTAIWYSVAGTYVPDSAYSYVVIGNFFADSLNEPLVQGIIGIDGSDFAYAFIDDLRASFDLNYCTLDLSAQEERRQRPTAYPMPTTGELYIRTPRQGLGTVDYALSDMAGRCVQEGVLSRSVGDPSIEIGSLPTGVYLLNLTTTQGSWSPITVVHVSP